MYSQYIIYADVLLLLNFLMDFTLLWAAGRFLRLQTRIIRLLIASVLGAAYGILFLLPQWSSLYLSVIRIFFPVLMLLIAYRYEGLRSFGRLLAVFYLIAFAMAGAVLGGSSLLESFGYSIGLQEAVKWFSLIFAIGVAFVLSKKGIAKITKNWHRSNFMVNVEVMVSGHKTMITALLDTGNDLRDPLGGKPVMVCEYRALMNILPYGLRKAYEEFGERDPVKVIESASDFSWAKKLRLIPFDSIGKKHGLLLGFRPDKAIIYYENKLETQDLIICLYQNKIGRDQAYQAIMNPEILLEGDLDTGIRQEVGA